jgi:hypothetical protein
MLVFIELRVEECDKLIWRIVTFVGGKLTKTIHIPMPFEEIVDQAEKLSCDSIEYLRSMIQRVADI